MPYKDTGQFEVITLWVPKGTKHRLRLIAAKSGYNGISAYIRGILGLDEKKHNGGPIAAQIGCNNE